MCDSFWYKLLIIIVVVMNIFLYLQIQQLSKPWLRFTYEDGVALYKICTEWWIDVKAFYTKNTDFKQFLLLSK